MARWLRRLLIFCLLGAALVAAGWTGLGRVGAGMCGVSAEATRAIAPQTGTVAVVYEYNCGATTDFATHVSILKPGATPLGPGNVFVADTDHGRAEAAPWGGPWAALRWTGPEALELSYDASARVFSSDPKVAGVTITFLPVAR